MLKDTRISWRHLEIYVRACDKLCALLCADGECVRGREFNSQLMLPLWLIKIILHFPIYTKTNQFNRFYSWFDSTQIYSTTGFFLSCAYVRVHMINWLIWINIYYLFMHPYTSNGMDRIRW